MYRTQSAWNSSFYKAFLPPTHIVRKLVNFAVHKMAANRDFSFKFPKSGILVEGQDAQKWLDSGEAFSCWFHSESRSHISGALHSTWWMAGGLLETFLWKASSDCLLWRNFTASHYPNFRFLKYQMEKKITWRIRSALVSGVGITVLSECCLWRRLCCIQSSKSAIHLMCPVAHYRTLAHSLTTSTPVSNYKVSRYCSPWLYPCFDNTRLTLGTGFWFSGWNFLYLRAPSGGVGRD